MKTFQYSILVMFCGLLLFCATGLPPRGDAGSPANRSINPAGAPVAGNHYIRHAHSDAHSPNMITAILADYRGFDTLGETLVVFTGGIAVLFIIRARKS